jgi:anti-sigma regulatory factor (Ser/Thr protein kinase)
MRVLTVALGHEYDVVLARQRTRQVAALLAFDMQDQTRLATAVSEIAHNAVNYTGGGAVELAIEGRSTPQGLHVRISDHGPGIVNRQRILDGQYTSPTSLGLGLLDARRLMDQCDIQTSPQGIAPEDQERVCEEFVQLEHPLQRHMQGTGLGLPLCKRLTTLLGSSIEVTSTSGVGSTFAVIVPLHYQPHAALPRPVEAAAHAGPTRVFGGYPG